MKFAICNETYGELPFEQACEDIAGCGYDGVEVAPFTLNPDPRTMTEREAGAAGRVAQRAGLEVVGLHWLLVRPPGMHVTTPDADIRRATTQFLQHLARLCAAMGGKILVFGSPKQRNIGPGVTYDDAFNRAAEVFRAVSETAGPLGVTLALEPLSAKEGNFLLTAAETVKLIRAVNHPACRLHLDVKAMSSEGEPTAKIIADNAAFTAHFHANDPNLRGPGFGEVDFVPIAAALKQSGYRGYVSVEVFDYTPDAHTIASKSIEYLKKTFA